MSDLSPEVRRLLGYEDDDDESLPFAEEINDELPLAEEAEEHLFLVAPDVSHVQAFRLIEEASGPKLDVRFKPNGNSGVRQYRYSFSADQKDLARMIYDSMAGNQHPGLDIWTYLIRGGIPYEETAVS